MPSLHCVKDDVPAPLVTRIKGSFAQRFVIVRERYVMALSRVLSGDIVEAIFDEDFGLSGEEESDDDVVDDGNIHALVGETILTHDDIAPRRDERSEEDEVQDATLLGEITTEGVDIASNQHSLEANTLNNEDEAVEDRLLENVVPTEVHEEGMCEEERDCTPNVEHRTLAKRPRRTTNHPHSENTSMVREELLNSESSTHSRCRKRPRTQDVVPHCECDDISETNSSSDDESSSDTSHSTDTDTDPSSSGDTSSSSASPDPDHNDTALATLTTARGRGRRRGSGRGRGSRTWTR
ncbi:putative uncharacterized protein DDB_G0282499 [Dysidea avara]|uniref:putative uncharacterized protein DDB_G0282499 n=1 Tax=Dysidea avara TaxID=196820 RepID=UPI00331EF756